MEALHALNRIEQGTLMKLQLKIEQTDGEVTEVTCIVPDFVAWERHSKRRISDLATGMGIEDMAYLAHSAIKRQGTNIKPFDGWIATIETIEMVDVPDPKATK